MHEFKCVCGEDHAYDCLLALFNGFLMDFYITVFTVTMYTSCEAH